MSKNIDNLVGQIFDFSTETYEFDSSKIIIWLEDKEININLLEKELNKQKVEPNNHKFLKL